MLPILVSLGPVKIYSYGVFLALGLFLSLYWWWKMGRDEHLDEIALFDSFFLFLMINLVFGRFAYVIMHHGDLSTWYRMIAILAYPGLNGLVGMAAGIIFLVLFARQKSWEVWKVLDNAVVAISLTLIFVGIGGFLNGSNPGGVISLDLWIALWALVTFGLVSRVRENFRFYAWYKGEASVVQEGLASLVAGGMVGVYYLGAGMLITPNLLLVGFGVMFVSGYLIYQRTGRKNQILNLLQWVRNKRRK